MLSATAPMPRALTHRQRAACRVVGLRRVAAAGGAVRRRHDRRCARPAAVGAQSRACAARGTRLVTLSGSPRQVVAAVADHAGTGVALPGGELYSCLTWVSVARAGGAQDVALCAGTSRGGVLVYAPDGELIHAQRVHDTPVRRPRAAIGCSNAKTDCTLRRCRSRCAARARAPRATMRRRTSAWPLRTTWPDWTRSTSPRCCAALHSTKRCARHTSVHVVFRGMRVWPRIR